MKGRMKTWGVGCCRLSCALLVLLAVHTSAVIQSPPRITKQPPSGEQLFQVITQQSEQDKPFVIECEADGEPPPQYRWVKNGKPFQWQAYDDRMAQQDGRGTLVVTSPRNEDIGQYQCFAENELGVATSNTVFMRKAELNSFKEEPPKKETVNEGQPFHLTCQPPDGWPKPNVHWLIQNSDAVIKSINNSRMTLDPEGTLWFSNVSRQDASDDFWYACSATSLFRSEYKIGNRVNLEVISAGASASQNKHPPVHQYTSRKNEVAMRGKKIELFCIYGGTPLPQIVWSKDGNPVENSDRVTQGHYGKSLIIKHVTFEDQGAYTCEASNGVGSAQTYSINLQVQAAPYFTKEPEFQNKAEEETAIFECAASGLPIPEIKWIYNGKPISEAPYNPRRKVTPNSVIIEKLEKKDSGNYGCNATNTHGYVYKDVYVNVLRLPPEITDPPTNESTVDGRSINMTCRAFGAPRPEVKWVRNGVTLTGGRYNVQENGDLELRDVGFQDTGVYTCYATSRLGEVKAEGSLNVKEHTRITTFPEDYEVPAGATATFRCNAVSDPSLDLNIEWLNNGQSIDFDSEPRFVQTKDFSLTITKTTELDTGTYTCYAWTHLDNATANATLIVQDAPNAPVLESVFCQEKTAQLKWTPQGDNRAPILYYTIQYNTSFTPDSWENAYENVPATATVYSVPMSPWANYTFRVGASNKIGKSPPSGHSTVCTTLPDVPYKNPDNVKGEGTRKDNMVISWTAMPEIEHNAPGFKYRVFWRRDIPGEPADFDDITDWRRTSIELPNLQTFQRYKIQVKALNEKGEANVAPTEIIGYSGEDYPLLAPQNFTVEEVLKPREALLSWSPVPPDSVRGHFRGYKIQTWTEREGMTGIREYIVKEQKTREVIPIFVPHTKNFARVMVFNDHYNGPSSDVVSFDTPEGTPGPVRALEGVPMGSSAILLNWKEPAEHNGVLTGYKIYYQVVEGTKLGGRLEREPHILDPKATQAKLSGLQPNTTYRFSVVATTSAGEGALVFDEKKTYSNVMPPERPFFIWTPLPSDDGHAAVLVNWVINKQSHVGSHFFVKYKLRGESQWTETRPEFNDVNMVVKPLKPGEIYVFKLVAVDGDFLSESAPQEVETSNEGPIIQPRENVAAAGWFIGMMLAIAFLLLVLIIVCIIKRNRGGKYIVHEREAAHGRLDYPEEPGFHEYSQPLDNPSHGRSSMGSDPKHDPYNDGDADSLAEYGDGDTEGMNEDGSFIGQYGRKHKQGDTASGGFTTLV